MGGTADEGQWLRRTGGKVVGLGRRLPHVRTDFAREITSIGLQWGVVEGILAVGGRSAHNHMSIGRNHGQQKRSEGEKHDEFCMKLKLKLNR